MCINCTGKAHSSPKCPKGETLGAFSPHEGYDEHKSDMYKTKLISYNTKHLEANKVVDLPLTYLLAHQT